MRNGKPVMKMMATSTLIMLAAQVVAGDWSEFRGAGGASVSAVKLPREWSEENIAWSTTLPGRGLSGPIVVDGQVIVTASSGFKGDRLHVISFDEKTGKDRWQRQFYATGNLSCHPKMCMATPTPASDGKSIVAFYSTNDLVCLDMDGNLKWARGLTADYPNAANTIGMSSSPVIVRDAVIVQVESQGDSFDAGVDLETGRNLWKIPRPATAHWASPVALRSGSSKDLVLLQGGDGLVARDPRTGEEVWREPTSCSSIPSVAVSNGIAFVPGGDSLRAVALDFQSKPTKPIWDQKLLRAGTPSPIVDGDRVYVVNGPILTCGEASTGKVLWKLRLKGSFSSTPVLSNGLIYAFNEDGLAFVIEPSELEGKIVSENRVGKSIDPNQPESGETILCSPAVANGGLYVRSDAHLWKIEAQR